MKRKIHLRKRPKMGRIPTAPPQQTHRDKSKYNRKNKHPKKGD